MYSLTEMQQNMLNELAGSPGGFGNGHTFHMIAGIKEKEVGEFIEYLYLLDEKYDLDYCELSIEESKKNPSEYVFTIDAQEKYMSDAIFDISMSYPNAVCYWNDQWDYEGTMCVYKNGDILEKLKKICKIEIEDDAVNEDATFGTDTYYECTALVTDLSTNISFSIGGGCISEDQRDAIYESIKQTRH